MRARASRISTSSHFQALVRASSKSTARDFWLTECLGLKQTNWVLRNGHEQRRSLSELRDFHRYSFPMFLYKAPT